MSQVNRIDVFQTDRGLHSCFVAGNVRPEWEKEFVKQHNLETLEDFVYLVEAQDWEKSVGELVKAVSSLATNRIAIARFKASYEAGSQAIKNAALASSKSGPDNMDEPLPEATFNQVQRDFQARYNVTFDPALDPADALRARVYREFRKGLVSVIPIRSVKSILSSSVPKTQETVQLATGLRVEFEKESFADVSSAVQYYFGLRTLMNAWAWAGCYTTKDHDGATKMMMTLSCATNYADEALRSCMEFAGGSVSWLAKNDTLTRGKLASLVRRGYCVQSALETAADSLGVARPLPSSSSSTCVRFWSEESGPPRFLSLRCQNRSAPGIWKVTSTLQYRCWRGGNVSVRPLTTAVVAKEVAGRSTFVMWNCQTESPVPKAVTVGCSTKRLNRDYPPWSGHRGDPLFNLHRVLHLPLVSLQNRRRVEWLGSLAKWCCKMIWPRVSQQPDVERKKRPFAVTLGGTPQRLFSLGWVLVWNEWFGHCHVSCRDALLWSSSWVWSRCPSMCPGGYATLGPLWEGWGGESIRLRAPAPAAATPCHLDRGNPKNLFVYVMNLRAYPKPMVSLCWVSSNVGSMPDDVRKAYTEWLRSEPAMIEAGTMGWVHRRRLYWVSGPLGGLNPLLTLPAAWSWGSSSKSDVPAIQFQGSKPIPPRVVWESGFQPLINPKEVMAQKGQGAIHTFTREFRHPTDRVGSVSPGAASRFEQDQRRFPPGSYEEGSLAFCVGFCVRSTRAATTGAE